jgi:hypothetical protein
VTAALPSISARSRPSPRSRSTTRRQPRASPPVSARSPTRARSPPPSSGPCSPTTPSSPVSPTPPVPADGRQWGGPRHHRYQPRRRRCRHRTRRHHRDDHPPRGHGHGGMDGHGPTRRWRTTRHAGVGQRDTTDADRHARPHDPRERHVDAHGHRHG